LLKHLGYPIRNYAVHGYTALDGLRDFRAMPIEPGSTCVIQFGGNDCDLDWDAVSSDPGCFHDGKVPISDFRKALCTFVEEARQRQLEPILIPCLPLIGSRYLRWVSRNRNGENILHYLKDDPESICRWQERYAIAVRDIANEKICRYLDVRAWMLERLNYPDLMCADGIHPNEEGHRAIAEEVAMHIGKHIC
jgi:lysophospholipase L1-like esterase